MKEIQLWKNRNELSDKVALVDDEDYEKVMEVLSRNYRKDGTLRKNQPKWYAKAPNAQRPDLIYGMDGNHHKSIHRVVMDAPKGMDVDHINGDTLDNRRENLRICTRAQNSQNKRLRVDSKSGYKGVYEVRESKKRYTSKKTGETKVHVGKPKKPWQAYISDPGTAFPDKRHIRLGYYATAEEAARAYDRKAKELYGEFALLNFPEEK